MAKLMLKSFGCMVGGALLLPLLVLVVVSLDRCVDGRPLDPYSLEVPTREEAAEMLAEPFNTLPPTFGAIFE